MHVEDDAFAFRLGYFLNLLRFFAIFSRFTFLSCILLDIVVRRVVITLQHNILLALFVKNDHFDRILYRELPLLEVEDFWIAGLERAISDLLLLLWPRVPILSTLLR